MALLIAALAGLASCGNDGSDGAAPASRRNSARCAPVDPLAVPVTAVALSPGGALLAYASGRNVLVRGFPNGAKPRTLSGHEGTVWALAFSPDGRRLVSAGSRRLILWDASTWKPAVQRVIEDRSVLAVAYNSGGDRLCTGGNHGKTHVRDAETLEVVTTFPGLAADGTAPFSPDNRGILARAPLDKNTFTLWNLSDGVEQRTFRGHSAAVYCASFALGGRAVVSADATGALIVWDVRTGKQTATARARGPVWSLCVEPGGKRAATASVEPGVPVELWDLKTGRRLAFFRSSPLGTASLAISETHLVAGGNDGRVRAWKLPR